MEKSKKIPEWKIKKIEEIKNLIEESPTIAIVNLDTLPTKQLQEIKKKLKNKIQIIITKKILIRKAFENSSQERLKGLLKHIEGVPGLLLSKLGAFELFKILKDNRSSAPIKPGQIAPEDIWIQAGPTPFAPGPVISDFGKLGIKTGVEGGKIAIKADKIIVKKGDKALPEASSILTRLGIKPMKIGISLTTVLENKDVYSADALDIDTDVYIENIKNAFTDAFKLSLELGIINSETAAHLIKKAFSDAKALAFSQNILTSETLKETISKAEHQAKALGSAVSKE